MSSFVDVAAATRDNCPDAVAVAVAVVVPPISNIVPIRVDVLSEDKTLRIVDTLLLDPTCWPVTFYQPFYASVEDNITQMAHTILSDAEVQGMGRTVRHFTGRLDLWNPKLQKAVEDQLRPQLWRVATMHHHPHEMAATTAAHKDDDDDTLVPISIRLLIDRLVVHDDFFWDTHGRVSPFEFAQTMAHELNLPDEATVAIATTILEQLHGLSIDTTPNPALLLTANNTPNTNNNINTNNTNTTDGSTKVVSSRGAWTMDLKEHASIALQVVAHHRSI